MATIVVNAIEVCKTVSGGPALVLSLKEAATQTFKKGAILALNPAQYVAEAAADEVRVLGVALEDGHNGATAGLHEVLVAIANQDTIFVGNTNAATAQGNLSRGFGIVKGTTHWQVDLSDTTNRRCLLVKHDERDAVGDTNGRVQFLFLATNCALAYTS